MGDHDPTKAHAQYSLILINYRANYVPGLVSLSQCESGLVSGWGLVGGWVSQWVGLVSLSWWVGLVSGWG